MSFTSLASSAMLSLRSALGVPLAKLPIDGVTFVSYVFPPIVCYFMAAVSAVTSQARIVRLALWPLVVLLALRAALSVDMSYGKTKQLLLNLDLALFLCTITGRTLDWALLKEPFVRHVRPTSSSPSTIMDALDLALNTRGIGWNWRRRLYIPHETRPANRVAFVCYTLLSAAAHGLIYGVLQRVVLTLSPLGVGPFPEGSTIFDNTLPFLVRYLRASIISVLATLTIYTILQMSYDLCTAIGVLVLGQDPVQWPPIFDAPWLSTSVNDFWGRRWHQLSRRVFLLGGYPLSPILGQSGIVIGTFLTSAALHHVAFLTLNSQLEIWWMPVGFGMMALGVLAERAFHRLTGKKVGGVIGWFWAMAWVCSWNTVIIEGFARGGIFGCVIYSVDGSLPAWVSSVEHLVADFDAWLHTV